MLKPPVLWSTMYGSPMTDHNEAVNWHFPAGSTADGREIVRITPEVARWGYSGLRVLDLAAGDTELGDTGGNEMIVLPLTGSCAVDTDAGGADLAGRADVFSAVTDCAYVPRDTAYQISTSHGGRFALACARSQAEGLPFRHVKADEVQVEVRGAGACSRRVNNFGTPDVLEADRLIACEVFTPAGNWSSFPPHKHDTDRPGESVLEEIYYFEVADGPSMAVPGYDLYYLNVMAGPGRREWLICDDPAHSWVREQWRNQSVDPRVTTWS